MDYLQPWFETSLARLQLCLRCFGVCPRRKGRFALKKNVVSGIIYTCGHSGFASMVPNHACSSAAVQQQLLQFIPVVLLLLIVIFDYREKPADHDMYCCPQFVELVWCRLLRVNHVLAPRPPREDLVG